MRSLLAFDRLDRYLLRLIAGPLALSLAALLLAQLLERLLRLFDLAASAGASPSSVLVMAGTLVPHYLGLALPMAGWAAKASASRRSKRGLRRTRRVTSSRPMSSSSRPGWAPPTCPSAS